jgi:predicted AlkP superfamily pyrophosphatase or phosphodiesterase
MFLIPLALALLLFPLRVPQASARPAPEAIAHPPYASPDPAPKRKLLIIGIDGLRPDAMLSVRAGNLKALIRGGAFAPDAVSDKITRSGPGWASVLTGVWHPKHGVVDNEIATYQGDAYPAFFKRLKHQRPDLFTACIVNWAPIRDRLMSGVDLALAPENDDSVAAIAGNLLLRRDPDVLFLHFDAPDHAGHLYGFSRFSPPYRRAIEKVDILVGKVLEALQARPGLYKEDWLILVTTDHGGSWRHHGEDEPSQRKVFLIVSGKGAIKGTLTKTSLVDLAPTAMAFMGIEVDPRWGWEGKAVGLRDEAPMAAKSGNGDAEERTGEIRLTPAQKQAAGS